MAAPSKRAQLRALDMRRDWVESESDSGELDQEAQREAVRAARQTTQADIWSRSRESDNTPDHKRMPKMDFDYGEPVVQQDSEYNPW